MSGPNALATAFLVGTAVVAAAIAASAAGKKKKKDPKTHPLNGGVAKRIGLFSNFAGAGGNRPNVTVEMNSSQMSLNAEGRVAA